MATVARVAPSGRTCVRSGSRGATTSLPASTSAASGDRPSPPPTTTTRRSAGAATTRTGTSRRRRSPYEPFPSHAVTSTRIERVSPAPDGVAYRNGTVITPFAPVPGPSHAGRVEPVTGSVSAGSPKSAVASTEAGSATSASLQLTCSATV